MTMREDGITDKQVDPFFEISAEDASALGLAEGDWARLVSRRGDLEARAQISDRVYPGLVWMALHFAQAKVNWLTHDVGDPLIGTPEYKVVGRPRRGRQVTDCYLAPAARRRNAAAVRRCRGRQGEQVRLDARPAGVAASGRGRACSAYFPAAWASLPDAICFTNEA